MIDHTFRLQENKSVFQEDINHGRKLEDNHNTQICPNQVKSTCVDSNLTHEEYSLNKTSQKLERKKGADTLVKTPISTSNI